MTAANRASLPQIDIERWADGNTGIPYVTTFESASAGPHAVISALTHGNEICGAHALAFLIEENIRPLRGRLTLAFANVAAHAAGQPGRPEPVRYLDEDFNRLWSESILQGPRQSRELARARALKTVIDNADYLLDLHSMQGPGPALALTGVTEKGERLAVAMGYPEYLIADAGHAAGPRMRDYGDFSLAESAKTALLIECGQHAEPMAKNVAIESALRFLAALGMIAPETLRRLSRHGAPEHQRRIAVTDAVTVRDESFIFAARYRCLDVVPKAGTVIAEDGSHPVRTPYDNCVLVMPAETPRPGETAVRLGRFLD